MRAGRLNTQITIRTLSGSRTASGAVTGSASTVATEWAQRTDTGGQETWRGRQLVAEVSAVFVIRHRTDVTPQMQVVDGSEVFEIVSVQNAQQTGGGWRALELMCKRIPVT